MNRVVCRESRWTGGMLLGLMMAAVKGWAAEEKAEEPSFRNEVLPILAAHCYECHGFDLGSRFPKEEPLRLDDFADAVAMRSGGHRAIVPGDPDGSLMMRRIESRDADLIMPPPEVHKPLSQRQVEVLRRWIATGARYERHWAYEAPPREVMVPETKDRGWVRHPIDAFVLARLEREGLKPSREAAADRWLRRVTYDLTGLPPAPDEVRDFLVDPSDEVREAVVDRLLASPHFGEHRAAGWLDVARYADSFGYQADVDMQAWPYRDWVVRAFNDNLPFDEFIIYQLAGDLLPDATQDQKLATAFNRIHRKTNEGGSVPEEFRQDGISDRVHTIGTAFMALTMECAQCHDHKYDPISAKDYYAMGAFFNSIDEFGIMGYATGVLPQPTLAMPTTEQEARLAALGLEIAEIEGALAARSLDAAVDVEMADWWASGVVDGAADLVGYFDFDGAESDALINRVDEGQKASLGPNQMIAGREGSAVMLNGDDAVMMPDFGLRHADQACSISLWVKPAEAHERAVIFANSSSADVPYSGYELMIQDGRLLWMLTREFPGNAAAIATTASVPVGEWTHVTVTQDGSRRAGGMRIYMNGELAETTVAADSLTRDYRIGNGLGLGARMRDLGLRGGMIDEVRVYRRAITAWEVAAIHAGKSLREIAPGTEDLRAMFLAVVDPVSRNLMEQLAVARASIREVENAIQEIVTMRESAEPVAAFILDRGDYASPTVRVERETPDWLPAFPEDAPRNRLGFAQWLTSPDHPLTARVTMNRIWQELFGRGIVETSDNFGIQGERPTHPELLDWLARDFIASGWDLKRAIRQIVLSASYGQDSMASRGLRERDPDNAMIARGPARRLSAEQLRDSALAVSGLLSRKLGGPSVKPYQPDGSMWKDLNNFLPAYQADAGEGLYRRSIYTFWRRTTTPPNMIAFDASTRDVCTPRRQVTNTPLQALVLLNDVQFVEAARVFGERILREGGENDTTRAAWAWRAANGGAATPAQLDLLVDLIDEQRALFRADEAGAVKLLGHGRMPVDAALDAVEVAVFTILAQALLNLDDHITLR